MYNNANGNFNYKVWLFFFYICVLRNICLKKENIKEDEVFGVTKKNKRMIKERKGKIDEEKNSMIKIDSDKEERKRKEKKKKEKRGKVMRKNERIFIGTFNFIYIKLD